jgi:uncharacterized protein
MLVATFTTDGRPVYDAIGKRYGLTGRVFNFLSKLRGGMQNNVGLELRPALS